MKTFKKYLIEMATPRKSDIAKIYYHGTCKVSDIKSIIDNGINPPDLSRTPEHYLRPIVGKVYITPALRYAMIYCIGGDMAGHSFTEKDLEKTPYGYLVVIDSQEIKDIQPDEDSIGKMIYNKKPEWLYNLARVELKYDDYEYTYTIEDDDDGNEEETEETMGLLSAVEDGLSDAWAYAGKLMLHILTNNQKLRLISLGAHVAHTGKVGYTEIWKFDRRLTPELKKDGSNFFTLAERIK